MYYLFSYSSLSFVARSAIAFYHYMRFSGAVPAAAASISGFPTGRYFIVTHIDLKDTAFKTCLVMENTMCRKIGLNIALSWHYLFRNRYRIVVRSELPSALCKTGN